MEPTAVAHDPPPEILVLGPPDLFRKYDKQFSSRFQVLKPWESPLPLHQFLAAHAQKTRAALCSGSFSISGDLLLHLPSLRLVVTTSAGINQIDFPECRRRGIAVANAATIFSADVADSAVGLILSVMRKICGADRFVKSGVWSKTPVYPLGFKLGGKKIGIVGLGNIGLEVAKRLEPFGCTISYHSRYKKQCVKYTYHPDICKLALESDILVLCCALTDETRHMVNRDVLLALGPEGVVVNIARGSVINEKELVSCLKKGEIGGAGLDVFENEPHVPNELFELDNVVLSPHCAVSTEESYRDLFELVCGNFEAFFADKPLLSLVSEE